MSLWPDYAHLHHPRGPRGAVPSADLLLMKGGGGDGGQWVWKAIINSFYALFARQDFEKISAFFKSNYKVELTEKDMCVKGWNWGTAKFSGKYNPIFTECSI